MAVTFARYYREISGVAWSDSAIAAAVLLGLTAINCLGARAGSNVQSALMLLKMGAIAAMVVAGIALGGGTIHPLPLLDQPGIAGAAGVDWRGLDSGGVCVRRMADRDVRRGRDAQSGARSFTRAGGRGRGRGGALPGGERGVPESAGAGGAGGHAHAGDGGDAGGDGGARGVVDRDGDCDFHAGVPQPGDADGAARVQRDGARRAVLRERGAAQSRGPARR